MQLPDVPGETLQPQPNVPLQLPSVPTPVIEPTPVEDKTDELLLNVDGDDDQTQQNNPCNQILADLSDLRFDEKNDEVNAEEKEIEGETKESLRE